jgi:thioesterase domain-containing protein
MHAQIEKHLGQRIPLTVVFQAPTIESLARMLERPVEAGLPATIVPLQLSGSKPPFFFVHPAGGHVFSYTALARHLGSDRPFYGLQAKGVDGDQNPDTTVEAMAAEYVEAIRAVQPEGPYLLGGWSLGGLVAFEMSRQLQVQGQRVALLALIDSYVPGTFSKLFRKLKKDDNKGELIYLGINLGLSPEQLSMSWPHVSKLEPDEQFDYIIELSKEAGTLPSTMDSTELRRLFRFTQANTESVWNYKPKPFEGRLILIRASERMSYSDAHSESSSVGRLLRRLRIANFARWTNKSFLSQAHSWEKWATGGVEVQEIPGNHFTMIQEPHVRQLAERLKSCIDAAENSQTS